MAQLGIVSQIWRYPVSSLGGEQLRSAALDPAGIAGDRRWGVVDAATNAVANPPERRWRTVPEVMARSPPTVPKSARPEESGGPLCRRRLAQRFPSTSDFPRPYAAICRSKRRERLRPSRHDTAGRKYTS
jgi:uncharacterized protein YcbX